MMKRILLMMLLVTVLLFSIFFAVRPIMCSNTFPSADTLLGAGCLWAANGGTKVAYVDAYDNLMAHPNPYGDSDVFVPKNDVLSILEGEGFTVDTFADIPANLSQYNLLYIDSYWACEPSDAPAISNYIFNGGGVFLLAGTICYFAYYSKTMNTGMDLSSVAPWFGASGYENTGGSAYVSIDNPLNTSLNAGDQLTTGEPPSQAGITAMSADSQVLATWDDGSTFAFTHTYGQGRVYWQSRQTGMYEVSSQPPGGSNEPLLLTLYGGFDYGITEQARVKVFAELRDPSTMQPISGANVTIQVLDPNDNLWVSSSMVETLTGTGIYEWQSPDTIANMNLQVGVYLAMVTASNGGLSTSDIMAFHVDPPSTATEAATLPFYLATIIAVALCGALVTIVLLKKNSEKAQRTLDLTKSAHSN